MFYSIDVVFDSFDIRKINFIINMSLGVALSHAPSSNFFDNR